MIKKILLSLFLFILLINFTTLANNDYYKKGYSFNFEELSLTKAFKIMGEKTSMNIVTTGKVKGEVNLYLDSVSLMQGIKILTKMKGLDYKIVDNTIIIGDKNKLNENFDKQITKVYKLKNANPDKIKSNISHLVDKSGIININERTKSLLITTYKSDFKEIEKAISELDSGRNQVAIKVRFEEFSHTKMKERGIDWSFANLSFENESDSDGNSNNSSGENILKLGKLKLNYTSALKMLEKNGSADVLANPRLTTIEGKEASIDIGDEIPVVKSKTTNDEGETTAEVEQRKVGISLKLTPRVTSENKVLINIKPKVTTFLEMVKIGDNNYPKISEKTVETNVEVQNGQTIAIGGLIQENEHLNTSKVPVLGDLPLLKKVFSSKELEKEKRELVVFITPEIIGATNFNFGKKKIVKNIVYEYEIKRKDSFWAIGNLFNLSFVEIMDYNHRVSMKSLHQGEIIKIPVPSNRFYKIEENDTLEKISKKYKLKINRIKKINNIKKINKQKYLILPVALKTEDIYNKLRREL